MALADPTRFHIVEMLAKNGSMPVSAIGKQFSSSPPAISQHLKVLKEANLVHVEVRAQQRIYSLNHSEISEIEGWLSKVKRQWETRFDALDDLLEEEVKKSTKTKGEYMTATNIAAFDKELDLILERVIDVPRDQVWTALVEPELVKRWFSPAPWKTIDCKIDLRAG